MSQPSTPSGRQPQPARTQSLRTTGVRRVQPPAQSNLPKVLRIGFLQSGKIIEEQVIKRRENVTIGQSESNHFVVAHPQMPGRSVLFELRSGQYFLNVRPFMGGKMSSPQGVVDLAGGAARRIPLDDSSRGKVTIGETTLLFQFVVPPPVQPRPQLPATVRGAWIKAFIGLFTMQEGLIGWTWLITGGASIALCIYFNVHDWPVQATTFDLNNKWLALVVEAPKIPEEDEGAKKAEGEGTEGEGETEAEDEKPTKTASSQSENKGPKTPLTAEQKAALEAQRVARLKAAVNNAGILAALGSVGGDAEGQAGADLLKGSGVASDIDGVVAKVGSFKTAGAGDVGGGLGLASGQGGGLAAELGGGTKVGAATGEVDSGPGPTEKKVKGKATVGAGDETGGTGILDSAKVTKTVRSKMSALQNCYEKALNKNPTLEGKISVKFTIGTSGRVTSANASSDSLGDASVTTCVLDKFKGFVFDKPEGGSVEYVFPIVFKPGG